MDIQAEKTIIIERFRKVNDVKLIHAIKNMLDCALDKEQGNPEITDNYQKLVMDRFDKVRKNPDRLLDWEEAKRSIENE